jgi:NADPH:quinone reductase-like Zn-dependent oxidoreductase
MRAAVFDRHGGPEVVEVREVPTPAPGPGEVLLRVEACGMNHLDLWVRRGLPIETTMPHIGGSDVVGVVVRQGPGVETPPLGTRVVVNPALWCGRCGSCIRGEQSLCVRFHILGEHTNGGFAEYAVAPADHCYELPPAIRSVDAAAWPISYQTAWRALVTRARLRPGEDVLVLGASGGTALAAIQIAKLLGARVFAVTGGADKAERLQALGADVVYDRLQVDWSREVWRDTHKRGVDVVVENVGQATWEASLRAVAKGGRVVTYGATTGPLGATDLRRLFWNQIEILGTTMASQAEFEAMLRVALRGQLPPVIDAVLPLERAREAHERLERGQHFGKIVLVPGPQGGDDGQDARA